MAKELGMPTAEPVLVENPVPHVVLLRLNRPEARNALDMKLRRLLTRHFQALAEDDETRVIVLAGSREAFAAGADLKEMAEASPVEMIGRKILRLWRIIAQCPKPVIAAVNGYALGGGCELAMHADIIVAGEGAKFGQPEVRVGIMPGGGGTQRLVRAIGKFRAMKMLLTGDAIDAHEAFAAGLVSEVVPDERAESRAIELATQIAALPPLAIQQIKEAVLAGEDSSLEAGLLLERKAFDLLFATEDQKEGMKAFLEKRKPHFKGR